MSEPTLNIQSPLDDLEQNLEQAERVLVRTMNLVDAYASQISEESREGDYGALCPSHRTRAEIKSTLTNLVMSGVKARTPLIPGDEPDWDEVLSQAEVATGLKVERHTFSIIMREVRHWLHERSLQEASSEKKGYAQ